MTELFSQYDDVGYGAAENASLQSNYQTPFQLSHSLNPEEYEFRKSYGNEYVNGNETVYSKSPSKDGAENKYFSPENSREVSQNTHTPTSFNDNGNNHSMNNSFHQNSLEQLEQHTPKVVYYKPDWLQTSDYDENDFEEEEDLESQHEEDEYVTQFVPYVNTAYKTIGDMQFDEAMKRLTNIFQKTSHVDIDKASPLENKRRVEPLSYGNRVHQNFVQEQKQHEIFKVDITRYDTKNNPAMKVVGKRANSQTDSPEVNAFAQRSFFSMQRITSNDVEDESIDFNEDDLELSEKIDGAIEALRNQGISLESVHYSDYPKPKSIPLTEHQWEQLVKRLLQPSEKKKRAIEKVLREKQEKEQADCTYRPNICENSRQLASGHKSIFDSSRLKDELKERQSKIQSERQKLEEKRNEENVFRPKINKNSQNIIRGVETFEAWEKNKREKIKSFAENNLKREIEGCTFNPNLSERSRKIISRKNFKKSVWDRNYEFEFEKMKKVSHLIEEQEKQFSPTPEITEKAKKLQRTEKIGDRLHNLAMETLTRKKQKREELFGALYSVEDSLSPRDSLSLTSSPVTSRSYFREIDRTSVSHENIETKENFIVEANQVNVSEPTRKVTTHDIQNDAHDEELEHNELDYSESDTDSEQGFKQLLSLAERQQQISRLTQNGVHVSPSSFTIDDPLDSRNIQHAPLSQHKLTSESQFSILQSPQSDNLSIHSQPATEDELITEVRMNQVRDTLARYHAFRRQNSPIRS